MFNQLEEYRKKLSELSEKENILRNLQLKKFYSGEMQGPLTGLPSIDKPWVKSYSEEAINQELPKMTAYDYMYNCNKDNQEAIAVNFHGKITYKQLFEKIEQAERAFLQAGIKRGDYVTFCAPTLPETIYAFYALNKIGAVCNFVDLRMNKERIQKYINDTNSKLVVSLNEYSEKVYSAFLESKAKMFIDIDGTDLLNPIARGLYRFKERKNRFKCDKPNTMTWQKFIQSGSILDESYVETADRLNRMFANNTRRPSDPAAIVYTGGTTGEAKGAVLSNDSINLPCFQYSKADIPRGVNDRFIDIMPPFIAYGLVDGIQLPLTLGMESILFPKFDPFEFSQVLKEYKPEHFVGIPLHYEILMSDERCKDLDLSFVKNAGVGGDTIPETLEKNFNKFLKDHGCPYMMRCGFGMTENGAMSIYDTNNAMTKEGRLGIPMQKITIGAFDENGKELGYNEKGELYINSPSMIIGYHNNPEETRKTLIDFYGDKWIKTGDIVAIDEDGNMKYYGRLKNMVVRPDGHNVWPELIRDNLFGCPIVKDVCVVGITSKYNEIGKIPTAIVVLKDPNMDKEEAKKQILEYQSHLLGERDGAIDVRFRESLPLTPIGKIDSIKLTKEENETLSEIDFATLTNNKKKVLKQ